MIHHANISVVQWIPHAILDRFIKTKNGRAIIKNFLNQNKNNQVKKLILTQAWSEGKLALGICSNINFHAFCKLCIGLSTKWICCIIIFIITHKIIQYNMFNNFIFPELSFL